MSIKTAFRHFVVVLGAIFRHSYIYRMSVITTSRRTLFENPSLVHKLDRNTELADDMTISVIETA